jgi:hypothetical protein
MTPDPRPLSAEEAIWCDVCGRSDDAPHTPIDHPWLLKGYAHRNCKQIAARHAALVEALEVIRMVADGADTSATGYLNPAWVRNQCDEALRAALIMPDDANPARGLAIGCVLASLLWVAVFAIAWFLPGVW